MITTSSRDTAHGVADAWGESVSGGQKVTQEWLGYSSVAITGDIYNHVSRQVDQGGDDQVANFILVEGA